MKAKVIIDEAAVHQLFIAGVIVDDIAEKIDVNVHSVYKFISIQRKLNPGKWPTRKLGGALKKDVQEGRVVIPILASHPPLKKPTVETSPVTRWRMTPEEIERRYPTQKPPTNYDGMVRKAPIGTFSDGRAKCQK